MNKDNITYRSPLEQLMKTPSFIKIAESGIPKAGLGVYAREHIPAGMYLGTYEGEYSPDVLYPDSAYMWGIYDYDANGKTRFSDNMIGYIDAYDPYKSNWLRYVNGAKYPDLANVDSKQHYDTIEYWSNKNIRQGEELFIYYGDGYTKAYNLRWYDDPI